MIQEYSNYIYWAMAISLFIWLKKDILEMVNSMLSEGGKISSKRVITIATTATFLWLCVHYYKPLELNPYLIIALVCLIVIGAGLATLPQLLEVFNNIKGNKTETPPPPKEQDIDRRTNDGLNQP